MKKLVTSSKWKRHSAARSRSQEKAKARVADYIRRRNSGKSGRKKRSKPFRKTDTVRAPEVFSLIENPNGVIGFLGEIKRTAGARNVHVDLAEVTRITPEAIAALLATIHNREVENAKIGGNLPKDLAAMGVLNDSGFWDYVRSKDGPQYRTAMGKVRKRSKSGETVQSSFDQFVAKDLIEFATEKLTGHARSHPPSFSVFGEAMLNTLNHASAQKGEREPWWASVYVDARTERACFTFVDQGVGIFRSHRLTRTVQSLKHLRVLTRAEILQMVFRGEVASSTGVPGRGNGIPGMYRHCKAGRIKNFVVVANNVIGRAETEHYAMLTKSFEGTILYWEAEIQ